MSPQVSHQAKIHPRPPRQALGHPSSRSVLHPQVVIELTGLLTRQVQQRLRQHGGVLGCQATVLGIGEGLPPRSSPSRTLVALRKGVPDVFTWDQWPLGWFWAEPDGLTVFVYCFAPVGIISSTFCKSFCYATGLISWGSKCEFLVIARDVCLESLGPRSNSMYLNSLLRETMLSVDYEPFSLQNVPSSVSKTGKTTEQSQLSPTPTQATHRNNLFGLRGCSVPAHACKITGLCIHPYTTLNQDHPHAC